MKRLREDGYGNPQLKRPFGSSRGESYGQSQVPGSGLGGGGGGNNTGGGGAGASASTQKLTTNDALSYLKEVKEMFQDQKDKYDLFLDVMKDFKARRIDIAGVIARVKDLFKEHPKLILGFNTFLPKGYEITLNEKDEPPPKRTVEFVNKIRKRFQNDDHVYISFLDILNMYRKEHEGISEVYHEVAVLFDDHPDLLDEFTKFLPDTSATALTAQTDKKKSSVKVEEFGGPHEDKDVMKNKYCQEFSFCEKVADLLGKYHDLMEGFNEFLERCERVAQTMMKLHQAIHDQDYKEPDNENNGDLSMQRHTDKKKSTVKIEEFGGSHENKDAMKNMYSQEFTFCEKVKERLQSSVDYQAFLKCLHLYSTEIISRKELQSLVADRLGKYPDLMEGFNEFLEHCERVVGFLAGIMNKSKSYISKLVKGEKDKEPKKEEKEAPLKRIEFEESIIFVKKVKERFKNDDHVYDSFLEILREYREEYKTIYEVYHEVAMLFIDHPDLLNDFTKFLPDSSAISMLKQYLDKLTAILSSL